MSTVNILYEGMLTIQPLTTRNSVVLLISHCQEMDNVLGNLIKEVVNLPDGMKVEVFRTIASFPAISLPILKMTSNELAGVSESNRGVSLEEHGPILEEGGGEGVSTM